MRTNGFVQKMCIRDRVIPELNGKLIGSAQRVPVPTGSTTILVAVVKGKDVTKESINAAMKAATSESFGYNEDPVSYTHLLGRRLRRSAHHQPDDLLIGLPHPVLAQTSDALE